MENLKEKIEYYNHQIFDNEEKRKQNNEKPFKIIQGEIPIILSAPHCVKQTRNGKMKQAEGETGAIVQIIAKDTKCYAIYKTYNKNDDANYDIENNLYKQELSNLINQKQIKLLIDIHGAKNENKFDIEIGTNDGENIENKGYIVKELKEILLKQGIKNIVENVKFKASSMHTISKYIHEKTKIPCIQLEITGRYRYIENIDGIEKLINGIEQFIKKIEEIY